MFNDFGCFFMSSGIRAKLWVLPIARSFLTSEWPKSARAGSSSQAPELTKSPDKGGGL